MAVASAGPYTSLHHAPDRQPRQHHTTQFFTDRMPFLPPNQQRQSTEGMHFRPNSRGVNFLKLCSHGCSSADVRPAHHAVHLRRPLRSNSSATCGSCPCREHITNSVIGVSRPPVLDCGTTFHLDYGGRDLPSTPSDNL